MRWVVPRANRWHICKLCHDDIGHFGLKKNKCKDKGIKHMQNAIATPRANVQCKRFNRTVLRALAAINGGMEDNMWDTQVNAVQRGLNGTVPRALCVTPAEALFGCKP